jgi:hypothetical protein
MCRFTIYLQDQLVLRKLIKVHLEFFANYGLYWTKVKFLSRRFHINLFMDRHCLPVMRSFCAVCAKNIHIYERDVLNKINIFYE